MLITHSTLRERQEGFESKHWDDYRAATEVARDDGSAILTYSNHFMLASVLLMHLKPNSPVLKDVALSWPLYLLYPNAGELLLIRTLLSHCYQKEGVNFLVNNFEQIIPEHLLFLSEVLMDFEDFGLIDLVVNNNGEGMDKLPKGLRDNEDAMAEAIENNVRKTIVDENPVNPKYFDQMSTLLEELIKQRREN